MQEHKNGLREKLKNNFYSNIVDAPNCILLF